MEENNVLESVSNEELFTELMERLRFANGGHDSCYFIDKSSSDDMKHWNVHTANCQPLIVAKGGKV